MSTPGCPTLDTAPTVHHPVTAANKKPAENPGRFTSRVPLILSVKMRTQPAASRPSA